MDAFFDSPFFDAIQKHFYMLFLYGGAIIITLYLTYLAWLQPEDYLEATAVGMNRPLPESFRMFMGRYLLPITLILWVALIYIAFTT